MAAARTCRTAAHHQQVAGTTHDAKRSPDAGRRSIERRAPYTAAAPTDCAEHVPVAREHSVDHPPLVLSIDVGSSSVRASAHSADGSPLPGSEAQIASSFDTTPDGGVQIEADALFDRLAQAIDVTLQRLGPQANAIQGVGASVFASRRARRVGRR